MENEKDMQDIISKLVSDPTELDVVCDTLEEQADRAKKLSYGAVYLFSGLYDGVRIALQLACKGKALSSGQQIWPINGEEKEIEKFIDDKLIEEGVITISSEDSMHLTEKGVNMVLNIARNKRYLEYQKITEAGKQYLREIHQSIPGEKAYFLD